MTDDSVASQFIDPPAAGAADGADDLAPEDAPAFAHIPVLPEQVLAGLNLRPGGHYLDCTVGGGGHSGLMLQAAPDIQLTALDQDALALAAAQAHLATAITGATPSIQFHQVNFAEFNPGKTRFDGILADLGVSSAQLDLPERGFSFRHTAPLDMRMDQRQPLSAAEIINHWEEKQLADIFYQYGEERLSRRIARQIVSQRPFQTTTELAEAIAACVPGKYRHGRIHPATRTFQGLRIAVNRELEVLETWLTQAPTWLNPGGRIVVISFHSLEDRIVKHRLKENPLLQVLTKKPAIATAAEVRQNPRSRSAKLRIAERTAGA